MNLQRTFGFILLVVGVTFLYLGLRATDSLGESIQEGLTGRYSDRTTWYIVGGAVAVLAGTMVAFFGNRPRST